MEVAAELALPTIRISKCIRRGNPGLFGRGRKKPPFLKLALIRSSLCVCFCFTFDRLVTVPSLEAALAAGEYVTHTGPCGACSSLQDLATMISANELPMKGNDCYWSSGGLANVNAARTCYEDLGFTSNCARILSSYQDRINRKCPSVCAAFALGQGQDSASCSQSTLCYPCVELIEERYRIVSGRTDINSGYPSWSAAPCSRIATLDVVSQGDACEEARQAGTDAPATPVGIMPFPPPSTPVAPFTLVPTPNPSSVPAPAPTRNPTAATAAPTSRATLSANLQMCQDFAAIEVSLSSRTGGTVVCDCSAALDSPIPKCYTSPERREDQVCAIQFGACDAMADCCSVGARSCRLGQCRSASRTAAKSSLRLGAASGLGGGRGRTAGQASGGGTRGRRRIRGVYRLSASNQ